MEGTFCDSTNICIVKVLASTGYFRFGQRGPFKFISDGLVVSLIYLTCTNLGTTVLIFLKASISPADPKH